MELAHHCVGARAPASIHAMTHRVYVRWPDQRVTEKTTTESRRVAEAAVDELKERAQGLLAEGALGIAWTEDGKQVAYLPFAPGAAAGGGGPLPS